MGCAKVSAGCKNCYAESLVSGRMKLPVWGEKAERRLTSEGNWRLPYAWNRKAKLAGERHRVFCSSLADVFEPRPDLDPHRLRLARLIEETPSLDWLLLTKRPEAMEELGRRMGWSGDWPANVWAGTTVEDQDAADKRIPKLFSVPARIRFLSVEPMLEPIDLKNVAPTSVFHCDALSGQAFYPISNQWKRVDWIIVGGESGPGARFFACDWARWIRNDCQKAGVPFFFKQTGSVWAKQMGFADKKGGDPAEWPEDLRIQEFPVV